MITRIVITLLISMISCFYFQEQLMDILRDPVESVILTKQQETMPDGKVHDGIKVPSVEIWNEAKDVERIAASLGEGQRNKFYNALDKSDMEFHARSVTLLRAAKALPEKKRVDFVKGLGEGDAMTRQLLALLESDPSVEAGAGSSTRMLSALKPTETFMLSMKLALYAGIVLAFPLLLMFILQFVLPGLHDNERKVLWPSMAIGFGLFIGGVLFAYFFVLPRALIFFYEWGGNLGISNEWRIGEYITFATQFTLLFGMSFELPVVVMVMVKLGLLTYETMSKTRRYAILAIFIAAALITPTPDLMTLNLMALPMILLYEICIWLAYFHRKKEREEQAREEEEMRQRRLQWLIKNDEREQVYADHTDNPHRHDPYHDDHHQEHNHEEGWHDEYRHRADHGMPEDEEWAEPEDTVIENSTDDIPEEERKRMHDENRDV